MFYRTPTGSFGPGFGPLDATMNWTGPAPKPQPRPQPVMMNSGYPVLDLIAGLGQVFNREPMTTPPYIPSEQGGDWGMVQPNDGSIFSGGIFGPMDERPSPGFHTMEKRDYDVFSQPWRDDTEQQDWLKRWDIQPANDARYLPTFPDPNDTSTGAAIRRDWHNSYKDFAKNTIGQYAPMFAEQMPQPQPQQSYGDFMGEIKNTASTLVNSAASQLGSGLGQALSFIPGLGPIMELIGQGANIASTVAGATGLGSKNAGTALNLIGSVANGAAGGASTAGAEEFGPPSPNGFGETSPPMQNTEGGMFSGLRPNPQSSSTAPNTPPFKPQPTPAASDGEGRLASPKSSDEGGWFKPLDQMFQEIDERQARGEIFDEKNNVWVKPATATGFASIPQEKRFGQATEDSDSPWIQGSGFETVKNTDHNSPKPPPARNGYQPTADEEGQLSSYLDRLHKIEGGYNDVKGDLGGPTNYGISTATYNDLRQRAEYQGKQWPADVKNISKEQANEIYRNEYHYNFGFNKIKSDPVRELMTDMAVNNGYDIGANILKESLDQVLGPKDYGKGPTVIGPKMRAAIEEISAKGKTQNLVNKMLDIRDQHYKNLAQQPEQRKFLRGWLNRNDGFRKNPTQDMSQWIKGEF